MYELKDFHLSHSFKKKFQAPYNLPITYYNKSLLYIYIYITNLIDLLYSDLNAIIHLTTNI